MNKNVVRGLIVLTILIGIIGMLWLKQRNADTSPEIIYEPGPPEVVERIQRDREVAPEVDKVDNPPEADAPRETAAEVLASTEKTFPRTRAEFEALPLEEQEALKHAAEAVYWKGRGLEPPPPGYTYRQNQDGYHLVKRGEPLFRVTWDNFGYHNDHQLSDAEWEEYKALEIIVMGYFNTETRRAQATPEVVALAKERYEKLREKTWGPMPSVSVSASGGLWNNLSTQEGYERINRLAMEKLDSLLPPPRSARIANAVVDRLIIELKAELEEE